MIVSKVTLDGNAFVMRMGDRGGLTILPSGKQVRMEARRDADGQMTVMAFTPAEARKIAEFILRACDAVATPESP